MNKIIATILNNKVKKTTAGWFACWRKFVKSICCFVLFVFCSWEDDWTWTVDEVTGWTFDDLRDLALTAWLPVFVLFILILKSRF